MDPAFDVRREAYVPPKLIFHGSIVDRTAGDSPTPQCDNRINGGLGNQAGAPSSGCGLGNG